MTPRRPPAGRRPQARKSRWEHSRVKCHSSPLSRKRGAAQSPADGGHAENPVRGPGPWKASGPGQDPSEGDGGHRALGVPGLATRTQGPLLVNSLESAPLSPHTTIAIYSWLFFPKSAPQSPPPHAPGLGCCGPCPPGPRPPGPQHPGLPPVFSFSFLCFSFFVCVVVKYTQHEIWHFKVFRSLTSVHSPCPAISSA